MATITSPRNQSPGPNTPRLTSPSLPSQGNTPTSSVRPSIDLPRNGGGGRSASPAPSNTSGPAAPAQRRNRAALRDYYNIKAKGTPAVAPSGNLSRTASIASNASDSTITSNTTTPTQPQNNGEFNAPGIMGPQLDDPSFDADAYISQLLTTSSLRDILRTESALVSEIRNLDGERKALVYDNYSKLIKAVGTIGEMQRGMQSQESRGKRPGLGVGVGIGIGSKPARGGLEGVELLEEKLDGLSVLVKELGPGEVVSKAERKRQREERRFRRQKDLVKWVLEAPGRLESLMKDGKKKEAEQQWQNVKEVLAKWGNVKGVAEVRNACDSAMAEDNDSG